MKNPARVLAIVLTVLVTMNRMGQPILAVDAGNGFNTNVTYIIRSNEESGVHKTKRENLEREPGTGGKRQWSPKGPCRSGPGPTGKARSGCALTAGRHDPGKSFFSWLMAIAHNLAVNHVRKRGFGTTRLDASMGAAAPAGTEPQTAVLRTEKVRVVRDAIRALPEACRAAVLCRHWLDLSYAEIARVTGRSPAAVKSDLHYGRRLLRERLHGRL